MMFATLRGSYRRRGSTERLFVISSVNFLEIAGELRLTQIQCEHLSNTKSSSFNKITNKYIEGS